MKASIAILCACVPAGACGGSISLGDRDGQPLGDAGDRNDATSRATASSPEAGPTSGERADTGVDRPSVPSADATVGVGTPMAIGSINAPDCVGCVFPSANAPPCSNAPPITIVYPADATIVPPNLNALSIQWTPYGGGYQRFSVDFSSPPYTDWHVVTSCANQTTDMQAGGNPSGGCEVALDPVSWNKLAAANRDSGPVAVTVRGTPDGLCVTASSRILISFAKEDLLGTYFYWKSVTTSSGVGGQIWMKEFGDLNTLEQDVTSNVATATGTLQASCNGCHALSRDGTRMVVYSDDGDSDDEYGDVRGSFLDLTPIASGAVPTELGDNGVSATAATNGQPPGFSAVHPNASFYISSNGLPETEAGAPGSGSGYPDVVPPNGFTMWDGQGIFTGSLVVGSATDRPTMPDWSIDGTSVIYVLPSAVATYDQSRASGIRTDDDHIFGGSLYTMSYGGNGRFGPPSPFLKSAGENNYYPTYSPDSTCMSGHPAFVLFNSVSNGSGSGTSCNHGLCGTDSFSNPDARLMLMANTSNATPIDLEKANGSPTSAPIASSNSYPRWAPFVQGYKGNKILWFTFSSTRDYGLRVLNHKSGMHPCYPPGAPETPDAALGSPFDPLCQQPQLWMAPILFKDSQSPTMDPSGVAFWVPDQDMTTHNHTAQWTWKPGLPPPPPPTGAPPPCMCSHICGPCGAPNPCGCCEGEGLLCSGSSTCIGVSN